MIKPVNSVMPNFRAIYSSKEFMQPEQIEVANRIKDMLVSDNYKDKKGKTLEEQAGDRADIFINQPVQPYASSSDKNKVNVTLIFSNGIDALGNKFGNRKAFDIGSFTLDNIETFPEKFLKINNDNNIDKSDNLINYAAILIAALTSLGIFAKDIIVKLFQ